MRVEINIQSRDYWVKIVGMLQQNWALLEQVQQGVQVYFIDDGGNIFDKLPFSTMEEAIRALRHNGFEKFTENPEFAEMMNLPREPFEWNARPIYSSGQYWR